MSREQLQILKQELNQNLLKPVEYLAVFEYLMSIGANKLAQDLIKTAFISYPNIGLIKNIYHKLNVIDESSVQEKNNIKVFCIGLSRTGTNSLSDALKVLGLNGKHWNGENSQILEWHDIENFQFLSDTPISFIFETLYYAYPDAYFIYTTRNKAAWVTSMENHFKWASGFDGFKKIVDNFNRGKEGSLIREPIWGVIHKNLYTNSSSWGEAHDNYDQRVKKFFSAKDNASFLPFDISLNDAKKWELLSKFIGLDFVPLRSFPRKNIKIQSFNHDRAMVDAICTGNMNTSQKFETKSHNHFIVDTVDAEEDLSLPLPEDANNYYAFTRSSGIRTQIDLIEIENCYLSIDFSKPYSIKYYIFDGNQSYLNKLSNGEVPFIAEDIVIEDKVVGFVEDKFSQFNICHLLLDKLPRAELFNQSKADSILLFKENKYIEEACELLKLNKYDIGKHAGSKFITLQFKKLLVTSSSSYDFIHPGQNISSHVVQTINKLKQTDLIAKVSRKIFIDRKDAPSRNIINYSEVVDLLKEYNFEIVQPEKLTVKEQIQLFNSATIVVAVHGAGLTNVAFCKEGTKVIELMSSLCGTNAFWKLATALQLDYHCLLTRDEEISKPDYSTWKHQPALYNRRDVIVPLTKLKHILGKF
jgi:hypothetical protein